jgi:hypothetical protein
VAADFRMKPGYVQTNAGAGAGFDGDAPASSPARRTNLPSRKRTVQASSRWERLAMGSLRLRMNHAKAAQPLPANLQSFGIAKQVLFPGLASDRVDLTIDGCREQSHPAGRNFSGRPIGRDNRVNPRCHMDVVAHHGMDVDADGMDFGKFQQLPLDPLAPMLVGRSVVRIDATQPRAPRTAGYAVVVARRTGVNKRLRAVVMRKA